MNPRKIGKILGYGIAGCAALILLSMLGAKLALDRVPRYQSEIKDWVFRETGYHIAFTRVSPAFRWYGPELYFDRLELRSRDDRRVLARAAGGRLGADLWQLFHSGKLFALRIELDAPSIVIARTGPASFALASEIVLGGEDSSLSRLALNDLPAGTLAIRRGFITIQGWNAALPRLELRGVSLDLRRASDLAVMRVDAQLPAPLGGVLSFYGSAHGAGRLANLDWDLRASARGMSFPGWRELLPVYLARLDSGSGAFEALAYGTGASLARADLDFAAEDVVTDLADGPSARFAEISGALSLTHAADRWTLDGRRIRARRAARRDPDSEFEVAWRADEAGLKSLSARASYLRAETLLPLAGLVPQSEIRDRLRDIAPTGEWMDTRVEFTRASAADPWQFKVGARFAGAGFAPIGRAPGLRGVSGQLAGDTSGGHLVIDTPAAVFNWPSQFPQPLTLTPLKASLYWRRDASGFLIATRDLELKTHDAGLHAKFALQLPSALGAADSSPVLTLASTIENGSAADAHLFLPRENLPAGALAWLNRAFIAGHLGRADAVIEGPLRHFPFRDGSGLFLVRASLVGLTLDYREGWPRIEDLNIEAEFRNEGMTVKASSGRAAGLAVDSAVARFPDFKSGELEVEVNAHGDAGGALEFLRSTPLDEMAEHGFSSVEAKGALQANVGLFLPFKQFDQRRVLVHVSFDDATVNRKGSSLAMTEVSGQADIDGAQVARADVHGRVLGGAFQMSARAPRGRPVTRTQLDFHGTLSGEALRAALSLPASIPIGGQTEWHGVLKMSPEPQRERSLRVSSNLTGLELGLPQPLAKPADTAWPSTMEVQWMSSGAVQLRLALGATLRGAMTIDSDANGAPKLGRVALMFGTAEPVVSDSQIVSVGGRIEELDLGAWINLSAAAKVAKPVSGYLRSAKLDVTRLRYLGITFPDVAVELTEYNGGWRIGAAGPSVAGTITLPAQAGEPWSLEFERFEVVEEPQEPAPVPVVAGTSPLTDGAPAPTGLAALDPRDIPAINFHAAQLTWGDRQFGDVRATLVKGDEGIELRQLVILNPVFGANVTGDWRGRDPGTGHIEGTITSVDVGDTLKRLGFADVIEAKSGRLDFNLRWNGAPSAEALGAATGHVQVALDKGQIVGLKPGARGRVLGLASIAELPRRLALDFSDITDKGFAFDTVRGDFELREGSAHTDNVLVKGPAAEIGLIGRVGLKNKDYDQIAVITGNLGSSPLPLAAFAAGPVVGGVVLLFTQVFKQPLKGLVRGYYRITGSWDNPTVERIKGTDAATATVEAPK